LNGLTAARLRHSGSASVDDEVRTLYRRSRPSASGLDPEAVHERYQTVETDEERREIALAMGKRDGRRRADSYAAFESE
jgi:hypothetical protein